MKAAHKKKTVNTDLPSFVVGINTCYCDEQIIDTVKSLRSSINVPYFRIIIVSDRQKATTKVVQALKELDAELYENDNETSAWAKQMQILDMITEEIIIMTQDDVLFHPEAIYSTVNELTKEGVTFVGLVNEPIRGDSLLEDGVSVGTRLNNGIAKRWNKGDNYLACLGRLMAFRTDYIKSVYVEIDSISVDAYLYFENKKLGGKYVCLWDTPIYFRSPQNLEEHMRKSSRFQHSKIEMEAYKRFPRLDAEYKLPLSSIVKASIEQFFRNPVHFVTYCGIFWYTRLLKIKPDNCLYPNWEIDFSTKEISLEHIHAHKHA
jgi:hypothetical protein